MAKLQTQFWVHVADKGAVPCTLIHFDGDSYTEKALVRFSDGTEERIRVGWLSRRLFDPVTYKGFRPMHPLQKHVMSGKSRESYVSRKVETRWTVQPEDGLQGHPDLRQEFKTMVDAICAAIDLLDADENRDFVELRCARKSIGSRCNKYDARQTIVVYKDGIVGRWSTKRHNLKRLSGSFSYSISSVHFLSDARSSQYNPQRVRFGKGRKY